MLFYFMLFILFLITNSNQETFRNCADIAIVSNTGGGVPPLFVNNRNPYLLYYRDYRAPEDKNVFALIVR